MANGTHQTKLHLYEEVADRISHMITSGTLKPGERVPSVRKLNARLGVSVSTVLQSYLLLEDRGLIEARPQSGFYVRLQPRELPPEPVMTRPQHSPSKVGIAELAAEVHEAIMDPDIIPLGAATPSPDLLPTAKLNRILAAVSRESGATGHRYDITHGNMELRRQIAKRSLDWGCELSPGDIVTTIGCTEALNLCLRAVAQHGDAIAVESPTYFGFLQILESLGLRALEIPTHPRDGICLDSLERAVKRQKVAACFVVSNFHNPLGSLMPDGNKKTLVELLSQRNIPIIEDDIYGDLHFGTARPRSLKAYDRNGMVMLCSSFSKTLSPGYRVGWTAPGMFINKVRKLKLVTSISTPAPTQLAVAEMLNGGGYDRYLRRVRRSFEQQVQLVTHAVSKYFPAGTRVTRPLGGFVLWVEFPKGIDSIELYQRAMEKRISLVPGPMFSPNRQYREFIRLNCGHPWSTGIEQALSTLGRIAAAMLKG
jgi:DNA-binding transcriptional MocR family regulator